MFRTFLASVLLGFVAQSGFAQRGGATEVTRSVARGVSRSPAARQVTGAPEHLQKVADGHVAGSGAWVGIAPVEPTNGSSYPAGTSIIGNTITLVGVPQRLWFEIQLGVWALLRAATVIIWIGLKSSSTNRASPTASEPI